MKTLLINNGTSFIDPLLELLDRYITPPEVQNIADFNNNAKKEYDLILLSGESQDLSVYGSNMYEKENELIRSSDKPLIGICLGFEAIAHTFNALLERREDKIEGNTEIILNTGFELYKNLPLVDGYESHRWALKEVPDSLLVLGRSNYGVEIIRHKERPIYGFQFHPEKSPASGEEAFVRVLKSFL